MGRSFQEKSLWVTFVSLIAGFAFYVANVFPTSAVNVMPHQIVLFGIAVALLVFTQIAGHVVIAVLDRRTETDERDRLIELKGSRNASYLLATGIFFSLCAALLTEGNFVFTHVLLGFWLLSQLLEIGSQLFLYRREG